MEKLDNEKLGKLIKFLTGLDLADYQIEIVRTILYKEYRRTIIVAATQVGKSLSVALGLVMLASLQNDEEIKVVAPTYKHCRIIMDYARKFVTSVPIFFNQLAIDKTAEELSSEVSRQRLTFKNGSHITVLSADRPESLLGQSGTVVVVDESGAIDDTTYNEYILRMLGAGGKKRVLIEIGNPISLNHFYETWERAKTDPDYKRIHIDWRRAVKAGRLDADFVMKQKENMSEEAFKRWYDAEFVLTGSKEFFGYLFRNAQEPGEIDKEMSWIIGVDVARFGDDNTVITYAQGYKGGLNVFRQEIMPRNDLYTLSTYLRDITRKYRVKKIAIDETQLGAGVLDNLVNWGINAIGFQAGRKALNERLFVNLKSEIAQKLKDGVINGTVKIKKDVAEKINKEAKDVLYMYDKNGRLKIIDPEPSPDRLDSLIITYYGWLMSDFRNYDPDFYGIVFAKSGKL